MPASPLGERDSILASFEAAGWRIAFTNCADVVDGLEAILAGWGIQRIAQEGPLPAHAHVSKIARGYIWQSPEMPRPLLWDSNPPRTAMSVIWDVHDVFFDWFLLAHPHHLCLHGAAVRVGSGLVAFPSVQKAGKSMLCAELAALGHRVYCDDVLPLEPDANRGVAMGIAPLLRRPLPPSASPAVRKLVKERKGPRDERWMYLSLRDGEIAGFGETAPVAALVLLERRERGRARLLEVDKSEMLKQVIMQNFARKGPAAGILDRLLAVVQAVPCYRLQYALGWEGAQLIGETLAGSKDSGGPDR